ncbi:hypothetical protein [Ruegeria sp.]|uniref:hypothetical protein n=1 Tax=Ruegeria sp. TaxID=1879320 RepID=UPI003C7ACCE5
MVETDQPGFLRLANPIMWACFATICFVALIVWFGLAPTCDGDLFPKDECPPKWRHLYVAPPNEVGDTLAGLAGVLAFIWLIATVLLQSVELGEQRRVLTLQKEEMEEQRKATQDMARSMAAQAHIFEDEQLERAEKRSKDALISLISSIATLARELKVSDENWKFELKPDDTSEFAVFGNLSFGPFDDIDTPDDEAYVRQIHHGFSDLLQKLQNSNRKLEKRPKSERYLELHRLFDLACETQSSLSLAEQIRFEKLKFKQSYDELGTLLQSDIWDVQT